MHHRSIRILVVEAMFLFVHGTALAGPSMESIEFSNSLENTFETPHTKWAKPYAGGSVRTLFITLQNPNINALPLRHVVELMQRFDITRATLCWP